MEQNGKAHSFNVGDIVQVGGRGQAMVVADPAKYTDRWWDVVPGSVVCEWAAGGRDNAAVHLADTLEVVGAKRRMSQEEVYELVTARAVATVTALAGEGRREMALGALQMWADLTGGYAQDADQLRLQQIADRSTSPSRD